jgi:HAD superfamily hydrolase (TIGR01509 family)
MASMEPDAAVLSRPKDPAIVFSSMILLIGVLWDFDGVIADTGELHYRTWARVLAEAGVPFDRETFHRGFGMINSEVLPFWFGRSLDPELVSRIADRKEELFLEAARNTVTLLPGVMHWLTLLESWNVKQAVASSAPLRNIEALTESLGIQRFFDALVSAAGMPGKPHPAVFLEAARRIGKEAGSCIVIEDSLPGIQAAGRAGMKCIAVTNTHPAEALRGADLVLDSLERLKQEDLRDLIDGWPS